MTPLHGFSSLTPYFTVSDADALMAFCTSVFGAKIIKEYRYEDGSVQHIRLQIADSLLMINQATEEFQSNISQMHLYVDNVEDKYRLALHFGAKSLMEPMVRPHGDYMAGFTDTTGNIWWIASERQ